jgi:hypothetical protein
MTYASADDAGVYSKVLYICQELEKTAKKRKKR